MHICKTNILITFTMSSTSFEPCGLSSERRLYMQLECCTYYMQHSKQYSTYKTANSAAPSLIIP